MIRAVQDEAKNIFIQYIANLGEHNQSKGKRKGLYSIIEDRTRETPRYSITQVHPLQCYPKFYD